MITIIIRNELMGRPDVSQSLCPRKVPKLEQRIKFRNYHLDLVKHPENVSRFICALIVQTCSVIARVIYLCLLKPGHIL